MTEATALKALVRHGTKLCLGSRWALILIYCALPRED